MSKIPTVVLCGNPNCGKTTIFNLLTGARHQVGNWPGVTVEKKYGECWVGQDNFRVVDLPGTYSLDVVDESVSLDEKIARDYILSDEVDLIVNIVDASNIERNLYLTTQLLEMGKPVLVLLNMMDVAAKNSLTIDTKALSSALGCEVIPISANRTKNAGQLKSQLLAFSKNTPPRVDFHLPFPDSLQQLLSDLAADLSEFAEAKHIRAQWLALRLLENDRQPIPQDLIAIVEAAKQKVFEEYGDDFDIVVADTRYQKILSWTEQSVSKSGAVSRTLSNRLDQIFLNKYLGIPIFLLVTYVMFMFTIGFGGSFIDFFDIAVGALLVDQMSIWLLSAGLPEWLVTILANGVGGGIQVVSTFVPIIASLYFFLAILEDSGYLARGAFVMDRFMQSIGLPGKSFIPLMVGLGCTVPAVYATRSLEYQKDRIMTVMMSPFISCGARLPVYILFAAVFFPDSAQNIVFALYLIGILVAVLTGLMLKHTLLKGEITPFVMELPAYHFPRISNVLIKTWEKLRSFILGAGKLIVLVVIVLSFLNSLGKDGTFGNENTENSVLSSIGKTITPLFKPMGVEEDNWPATVGIFTGLFAKEVVVGTIDSLYSSRAGEELAQPESFDLVKKLEDAVNSIPENLSDTVHNVDDPLQMNVDTSDLNALAEEQEVSTKLFEELKDSFSSQLAVFAYLLFILLYSPCVSALGATFKETNIKWTGFIILWSTFLAYTIATMVFQLGELARSPWSALSWIGSFLLLHMINFLMLKRLGSRQQQRTLTQEV